MWICYRRLLVVVLVVLTVVVVVVVGDRGPRTIIPDSEGPVFTHEPPTRVDFANSTGTRIECSARGFPAPTVTWVRAPDATPIADVAGLRRTLSNGTLIFLPFRADEYQAEVHSVTYQCLAGNPSGVIASREVQVRAVVLQMYEVQVYDEYVIRGNTAVMKCHIPSFVKDYVKVTSWVQQSDFESDYEGFTTIETGGRFLIMSTGELHILEVNSVDGTKAYRCQTVHRLTGETRLSATSHSGRLFVTEPRGSVTPRITDSKTSIHSVQGDAVFMPCASQGFPIPNYSWFAKVSELETIPIASSDRIQLISGTLVIANVQILDAGTYMCEVSNSMSSVRIETVLTVSAPLSAYIYPQRQIVDLGQAATLSCVVAGYPMTQVTWLKDGQPLMTDTINHVSQEVLRLDSVQKRDRGMYQCFVSNGVEVSQGTAELRLGDTPPEFQRVFHDSVAEQGAQVSLECAVGGNPTPEVSWSLDGNRLPAGEQTSNARVQQVTYVDVNGDVVSWVNVTRARVEDGGEYRCAARNHAGTIEHVARVSVQGPPYIRLKSQITVVAGTDLLVRCHVAGHPIDSVFWERDQRVLPVNHRQKVFSNNGSLLVQNVQRTLDGGRYTCVAKGNGQTDRRDVEVIVMVPPKIIPFSFQDEFLQEGMRAQITCAISQGDAPIHLRWAKDDDQPIPPSLQVVVRTFDEYASSLSIESVSVRHGGNYTCTASNPAAQVHHTARLVVNVPPRWVTQPQDASVLLGGDMVIACRADGFPKPTVTWMKAVGDTPGDYRELTFGGLQHHHLRLHDDGSLQLSSAKEGDRGFYLCKANNGVGAGLSEVVHLSVHVPAYFPTKSRNVTVKLGEDAQLSCEAMGDKPISVTWSVNKQHSRTDTVHRYKVSENFWDKGTVSELLIENVSRQDSGVYPCIAKNNHGDDEANVHLVVQEPPEPPLNVRVTDSTSRAVHLAWTQPYDGKATISLYVIQYKQHARNWEEDSRNLTVFSQTTSYLVERLQPATRYHARVYAKNEIGTSKASKETEMQTAMEAPGGPPQYLRVEALDSTSLNVYWKPPRRELWHGKINGYKIGYKLHESDKKEYVYKTITLQEEEEEGDKEDTLQELQLPITSLKKYTKYTVVVTPFNHLGTGPSSEEVVARTAEDVPSRPVEGVRCAAISSQGVAVSWDPPPALFVHGQLLGYKVLYRPTSDWYDDSSTEVKISQTWKTTLHGLEKYRNYSVQVMAFTRVGDGVKSNPIFCQTKEDVPEAPADVKALIMAADSIVVVWRPPSRVNGLIVKYTIYTRSTDTGKEETNKHIVSTNTTLIYEARHLRKNRRYEFWVTASTTVGEGQSTKPVAQTPSPRVPARIMAFDSTVVCRWRESVTLSCRSVGIPTPDVEWRYRDNPIQQGDKFSIRFNGDLFVSRVQSPDAGMYSCRVQNIHGSDAVAYTLTIQAPPPSPNVIILSSSFTTIELQWKSVSDGGTPIEGYALNYKRDFGDWEAINLSPRYDSYILDNLWCGTRYQIYMTSRNQIGTGDASETKSIRTRGSAPKMPVKSRLVQENSTSITLNLDAWENGGCPILYFVIEYKPQSQVEWMLVSNNVKVQHEKHMILDLQSGMKYNLRVTAHNSAGSTVAEYDFTTLLHSGLSNHPNREVTQKDHVTPFYLDVNITLPIALLLILLLVASIFIFCWKRRKDEEDRQKAECLQPTQYEARYEKKPTMVQQSDFDKGSFTCLLVNVDSNDNSSNNSPRHQQQQQQQQQHKRGGGREEIQPYATYQLPGCKTDGFTAEDWKRYEVYNAMHHQTLRAVGSGSVYPHLKKDECPLHHHGQDSSLSDDQEYASPVRSSDTSDSTSGTNNPNSEVVEQSGTSTQRPPPPKPRKPGRRAKVPDLIYRRHGDCVKPRCPELGESSCLQQPIKIPRPQLERPTAPTEATIETTFSFLDKMSSSQESTSNNNNNNSGLQTSSNSTNSST